MSEQQMPVRIWAISNFGVEFWSKMKMPIYDSEQYVRADIAERIAEALERCIDVFNVLADDGNYPTPLYNNGGWEFATKALSAFRSATQDTEENR